MSVHRGSVDFAECFARLDVLDREKRLLEKFLRDGERELSAAAESELVRFGDALDSWLREALSRAGYHRPNRGPWRGRRMSQTETKAAAAVPPVPTGAERDAIFRRARKGDAEVLPAIRTIFDAEPATLRRFGNMRVHARDALIALITSNDDSQDVAVTEALERMMEKARVDLAGPDPSPMESLLAARAAQDWLAVHIFEFFASSDRKVKRTIAQARWHESRMDRAHTRFLASMRTLAQVKRLLRKPVPSVQINAVNAQAVFGIPRPCRTAREAPAIADDRSVASILLDAAHSRWHLFDGSDEAFRSYQHPDWRPAPQFFEWHANQVFKGMSWHLA